MQILERFTLKWKEVEYDKTCNMYKLKSGASVWSGSDHLDEWEVVAVDPVSEISESSYFYEHPDIFNTILTGFSIRNGEWKYSGTDEEEAADVEIWESCIISDLEAHICRNHVVYFYAPAAGGFFYSPQYDQFVLYSGGRYEDINLDIHRRTAVEQIAPVIKRLYESEATA